MTEHRNIIRSFSELCAIPDGDNEYAFYPNDYTPQWKIHLCLNKDEDIYPALNEPLIRDVSRFLIDEKKINHKYANGGDGFKTYTIYTGSLENTLDLAVDMSERFNFPETARDLEFSDLYLADGIYMRFEGQPEDSMFFYYGTNGIPTIKTSYNFAQNVMQDPPVIEKHDKFLLHSLAGHAFCARHYGAHYLGTDYKNTQWDKGIFESLGQSFTPDFIARYVDSAASTGQHKYNTELQTPHGITLDIASLTQPQQKTHYQHNIQSIMDKWDKAPAPEQHDDILSRYKAAKHKQHKKINAIAHKW